MKIILLLLGFLAIQCSGFGQQHCINFPAFKNYIFSIVEDSSNHWSEYPKPPRLTDSVLLGMEREIIADDTAKLVIEKLSRKNFESSADYDKAFDYLQKVEFDYSLLALTAHWNPDLRFFALKQLNNNLYRRPLVNARKMKNGEWVRFDKIATQFLIYLLESNPLFISGSENATIHSNYISTIALNLDLLTHENITDKKQIREWYKNDLQFEQAILKWKAHIK